MAYDDAKTLDDAFIAPAADAGAGADTTTDATEPLPASAPVDIKALLARIKRPENRRAVVIWAGAAAMLLLFVAAAFPVALLGRRLAGRRSGLVAAVAWLALPLGFPGATALLLAVCESRDRAESARQAIERDGALVTDRFGQKKPHPLLPVERDARSAMVTALKALRLPMAASEDEA